MPKLLQSGVVSVFCVLGACSSDAHPSDAGTDEPTGERTDAAPSECTDEGATRVCGCSNGGTGHKTCHHGSYGACGNCTQPSDGGHAAPAQVKCKAGYYEGMMQGSYKPGFASLGIAESPFEVQFQSEAQNGQPALALTLIQTLQGPAGEFLSYTVNGGCMQGLARSGGTDNPFVARLTGELDCNSGVFSGVMEGYYTLLSVPGLNYNFKGPISAQFDPGNDELGDGGWSASEPAALNGMPAGGGMGTWDATWVSDDAPDAGGVDPCAMVMISDAGVDAGD